MNGSLINNLSGTNPSLKIEVGMGATQLCHSDRHAFTVVWVSKSGKTVRVKRDNATRTDDNGMSESQTYSFLPNEASPEITVRLGKKGWKSSVAGRFALGHRSEYYDYSF